MENFCCFLIFIVIAVFAVKLFSKKVKELTSHGESDETDGTGWRTAGSSQDSEDLKRRQAEHWAQRMAKQRLAKRQRDLSPEPPKISEIKSKLEEERQRLTELKRVQEDQALVMQDKMTAEELEREIRELKITLAPLNVMAALGLGDKALEERGEAPRIMSFNEVMKQRSDMYAKGDCDE